MVTELTRRFEKIEVISSIDTNFSSLNSVAHVDFCVESVHCEQRNHPYDEENKHDHLKV